MHELSIAHNIVEIVLESVKENNAEHEKVSKIELLVGEASGVVVETLKVAMDSAVKQTILEAAIVEIIQVTSKLRCISCGKIIKSKELFVLCPVCNSFTEVIEGKELKIKSIQIN